MKLHRECCWLNKKEIMLEQIKLEQMNYSWKKLNLGLLERIGMLLTGNKMKYC
jgi:hypothetical protein